MKLAYSVVASSLLALVACESSSPAEITSTGRSELASADLDSVPTNDLIVALSRRGVACGAASADDFIEIFGSAGASSAGGSVPCSGAPRLTLSRYTDCSSVPDQRVEYFRWRGTCYSDSDSMPELCRKYTQGLCNGSICY